MDENIEKRFENFGTLQANQSTNPPKNSDIRSSVFSIPGDGNYATMTVNNNPNERKKFTSLYPENSSDDFELKGLGERIISFSNTPGTDFLFHVIFSGLGANLGYVFITII